MARFSPGFLPYQDWRQTFATQFKGRREVVTKPLYDKGIYISGTTLELPMFDVKGKIGDFTTNLPLAGQMPASWDFLVMGIRIHLHVKPTQSAPAAGAGAVASGALVSVMDLQEGTMIFSIADKPYLDGPIMLFAGGVGAWGGLAAVGAPAAGQEQHFEHAVNGAPDNRVIYNLPVPLVIPGGQHFPILLRWPAAVTLVPAQNPSIWMFLDGELMRPVQ